ncbi:aminotransferase class V-fold PLP-dependent enzyme [Parvicella tangerina]|uniref:Cysteine desulfurase n=1 Tax=Parvicella tangerina TaxID=2829795 RepID=A0A916JM78_9FLAO|nr:aminotransferase class V-fold PLP-dependent enzyme [Parvicella tangerina]CAG5081067.1 Cysteine desulfurase [Parvicella tangerina]
MEQYFNKFREGIIGIDQEMEGIGGKKMPILYADWTASGRNYLPIEKRFQEILMPFVANTHTETSTTGTAMTYAYHEAQKLIKKHVNASKDDVIICAGSGMTAMINKFQRILELKGSVQFDNPNDKPVVFITHMEHHSNQTSWLETCVETVIIPPNEVGLVDLDAFKQLIEKYKSRKTKIASVTACSNVTGIQTPYHEIAKLIHDAGGYCFVDFACSAPYVNIDMHPEEEGAHLDAIMFSPHKFLGGPGSSGVLIFNNQLYNRSVPDHPGGGTVDWTNPWGVHKYIDDIEAREDGGTPGFLQTMKTAMSITLKEEMGVENMLKREEELLEILFDKLESQDNIHILAGQHKDRLGVVSFYIDDLHYNVGVRLLNDHYGIQSRGGCSCAGTYGHYLLNVDQERSDRIVEQIKAGNFSEKIGWIRVSIHPTLTNEEVEYIGNCIIELAKNHRSMQSGYDSKASCGSIEHDQEDLDKAVKAKMLNALTSPFTK